MISFVPSFIGLQKHFCNIFCLKSGILRLKPMEIVRVLHRDFDILMTTRARF